MLPQENDLKCSKMNEVLASIVFDKLKFFQFFIYYFFIISNYSNMKA